MKKIVITGGAGFIGSHVVRRFVNKYPDYLIINLDALTYAGNLENLTDIEDEKNWLAAQAGVLTALLGGAPETVIPMKCTSNLWIQVTALQANAVLIAGDGTQMSMFQRQAATLANYGRLKKAVADAADAAAVQAIDALEGWPA